MKLVINTDGVQFFCTRAPELRLNRDTQQPRTDRDTGLALFQVQVMALDPSGGEVLNVTVAGEPKVTVGGFVKVEGLVAIPWSQADRSGVAYRASSVVGTGPAVAGVIGTGKPTGGERPAA